MDVKLQAAGLTQHHGPVTLLPAGSVLVYAPPAEALEALRVRDPLASTPEQLHDLYRSLLAQAPFHHLISSWRLHQLTASQIAAWTVPAEPPDSASSSSPCASVHSLDNAAWPDVAPLTALVTHALLERCPGCLDAYLRLEQVSERFGGRMDLDYLKRLVADLPVDVLLDQWWQAESHSDLTMLQLHQVEEELLTLFLAHRRLLATQSQLRHQMRVLFDLLDRQNALITRAVQP